MYVYFSEFGYECSQSLVKLHWMSRYSHILILGRSWTRGFQRNGGTARARARGGSAISLRREFLPKRQVARCRSLPPWRNFHFDSKSSRELYTHMKNDSPGGGAATSLRHPRYSRILEGRCFLRTVEWADTRRTGIRWKAYKDVAKASTPGSTWEI